METPPRCQVWTHLATEELRTDSCFRTIAIHLLSLWRAHAYASLCLQWHGPQGPTEGVLWRRSPASVQSKGLSKSCNPEAMWGHCFVGCYYTSLSCFIFYITFPILELVFIAEQNFWTYAWKIHKMCDRTLIAERNVCDEIRCRGKGTLRLLDFSGLRLYINSDVFFRIFPEIFSDIF